MHITNFASYQTKNSVQIKKIDSDDGFRLVAQEKFTSIHNV